MCDVLIEAQDSLQAQSRAVKLIWHRAISKKKAIERWSWAILKVQTTNPFRFPVCELRPRRKCVACIAFETELSLVACISRIAITSRSWILVNCLFIEVPSRAKRTIIEILFWEGYCEMTIFYSNIEALLKSTFYTLNYVNYWEVQQKSFRTR